MLVGCWLLGFCILTTNKLKRGLIAICDSMHSWYFYSAAQPGEHATSNMIWYATQPHFPNTDPTSPCHIVIMPYASLGSDKYIFVKLFISLDWEPNSRSAAREACAIPVRPPGLIITCHCFILPCYFSSLHWQFRQGFTWVRHRGRRAESLWCVMISLLFWNARGVLCMWWNWEILPAGLDRLVTSASPGVVMVSTMV